LGGNSNDDRAAMVTRACRQRKPWVGALCWFLCVILVSAFAPKQVVDALASEPPDIQAQIGQYRLRQIKNSVEESARFIIESFTPKAEEYEKAKVLYETAWNDTDAYIKTALDQLTYGKKVDLRPAAEEAFAAANAFLAYAEKVAPQTRGLFGPISISDAVEAAIKVFDYFLTRSQARREAVSRHLRDELTWKTWHDLATQSAPVTQ
jgi:hypothetical protein